MRIYNNYGISKFGFLVFAALIASIVYSIFHLAPIGYNFLEIEGQMEAQARKASVLSDKEIQTFLLEEMKKLGIEPEDTSQLQISRIDNRISISYRYDEVFAIDIGDYYYEIHTFHLNPKAEVAYK